MATIDKDFLVKNGLQVTDNASIGGNVTITGDLTVSGTSNIGGGSSYSDSDVDAHLNQSNPTDGYVLSWTSGDYAWVAQSGGSGGGIALTDLSVTTNSAGSAALSYDNSTGIFSYTPPDLSSYQTISTLNSAIDSHLNQSNPTSGYVLSWNGSDYAWVAQSGGSSYSDSDVDAHLNQSNPTDGYVLSWTSGDYAWVAQSGGSSYSDSDVDAHLNQSNPTSGYVLSWNGSDYAWVAQSGGGGGGGEFALLGTGNLYSSNLTNFANTYTSATDNFLAGISAGNAITSGHNNVAIGKNSGQSITTGYHNIAIGYGAVGNITTKYGNVGIGRYALGFNSSTQANTAVGWGCMSSGGGEYNTGVGYTCFGSNSSGSYNAVFGATAANYISGNSNYNTIIGGESGYFAGGPGVTMNNNTFVGAHSGDGYTGSNNTIIGAYSGGGSSSSNATGSNIVILGYQAAVSSLSVSNEITLGNSSITTLRCNATSITSLSDIRDKKDVKNLTLGLDFINELRPVEFVWNTRDGARVEQPDTGFIAQELKQVQENIGKNIPGLVYESNPEKLEASYGKLIPSLVKSIQDLSAKINELENKINKNT